ncbi:MAG TPA: VOC family protein [Bryobacteraceae bacterium]|nr:VOC family protein [Bryobacteraceae bacterium]
MEFYRNILGFEEIWRGSGNDTTLSWVNMKVPDGGDHVEFMLHDPVPEPTKRGVAHHICRGRRYGNAVATLGRRAEATGYTKPIEVRTGRNRRKQMNLYDPDGTRTELMEPRTVDGQPASSSTLPPPK